MLHRFFSYISIFAIASGLVGSVVSGRAAASVTFEAESGALGTDWAVGNGSPTYITISSNGAGNNPGSAARVATYSVMFPSAGTYQLYARVRVGPDTFNDDSMFYASSFGTKSLALNSDWILVNGLGTGGFSNSMDVVTGGGSLGSGMWKWINLSQFAGQAAGFTASAGNLTQTFQIGAREDGLNIDKFVFGTTGTAFTVSNLDTGTVPGSITPTNTFAGPDGIALHRFNPLSSGLNLDGANPAASLVLSGGVLCGTTLNGGLAGAGTTFYLSLDGSNFNVFRSFANSPDAGNSLGTLAASDENLFGTTIAGGSNGVGTVFLANTNGSFYVLKNFSAISADEATNSGGASPNASLALSGSTVFGTTTAGGSGANGTIFSMTTNGSGFAVLHDFTALDSNGGTNTDGASPSGGLIIYSDTLYGTASGGGAGGAGVVFSVGTNGGGFTILHNFTPLDTTTGTNIDGAFPTAGLVLWNGTLYGTTIAGGAGGKGVVFAMGTNGLGFAVLHPFSATDSQKGTNADGCAPCSPLAVYNNFIYGSASAGGASGSGTVFRLSTSGAQFQTIYSFAAVDSLTGTNRDGAFPVAGVLPVGNSLYGVAFGGGPGGEGTVFSLAIAFSQAIITNIVHNSNGGLDLYFLGLANSTNVIQFATNLASPSWQNISTNAADLDGVWHFTDTNAPQLPARFYRSFSF